ncbi:Ankyrin-3 [Daldinia childiae]|uniref:Ankyrin-3 n=1 Tax=Daldinia childiae TaxID=326645 RepID=UPI001447D422|nr:Ankyrin-3 [Daldinia childiae]KAF3063565.1 Ankyrin-3 [Daldinia childiae]
MHKALGILIRAEADFKSGNTEKDANFFGRPPLVVASEMGLQECVRLLLSYGADINKECVTGTALYAAIERGHANVARILLEHEHKPNKDAAPPGQLMPLTRAVYTGNTELVSVLIEHGTEVDFVDPYNTHYKTPLTWACMQGNLEMAKLLLNNKANINYTGGVSYTPLYAALQQGRIEMANYLLQDEDIDVKWVSDVGLGALHAGIAFPSIIRELLRRGVFVDSLSALGTALHLTALGGYPKSIQALLENDPKPNLDFVYESNVDIEDHVGCTPLQLACMYHKPSCVKVLLKAGANPNFKSNNGNDAVDILLLRTESDSKDALECLKLLLSRVYNVPVDDINQQGQTRLHRIQENTPVSMVQLLVEARVPLDIQDHDGYTPLSIAIRNNNESVSRYLIEQGASVNILSPIFGSIIHLAVSRSMLNIVKLLVDSGADLEAVDAKYGQSLLYTALGIQDDSKLKRMVQYLVDEAKAPIDQLGGQLGYPIIRAAELAKTNLTTGTNMLKFLIRRKAQLNVSDDQGRRAVHFACMSWKDDGIKALTKAGAEIGVKDKFGRMPIHFAASSPSKECFEYLFNDFNAVYIHAADHDNWTPLLWAARSGHSDTIAKLIAHNADIWARGCTYGADDWSALKLLDFANNFTVLRGELEPKIRTRINQDGEKEEWDDFQHNMKPGHWKDIDCKSCFVKILGIQWKCIDCTHDFSLCFKCYNHRSDIHYQEHNFEKIGPLYDERYEQSDINDDVKELLQEEPGDEGEEQGHVSDDIGW